MATRQSIRDNLRQELKIDPNSRIWSDTVLNRNIEIARRQIQQDGNYDWHFNEAVNITPSVASQQEYSLPTDFVRVEGIKYDTYPLKPTTKQKLLLTNSSIAVDGTPTYYYLYGDKIGLFQRPTGIKDITIIYRNSLAAFVSDASVEVMPDAFIEAIVQYAAYLSWSDVAGKEDKGIQSMQNYKQVMEGLYDQYLGRRDDANFQFQYEVINPSNLIY